MKVRYMCPRCGSDSVKCDAWARWDTEAQDWYLDQTFDASWCDECDEEIGYLEEGPAP